MTGGPFDSTAGTRCEPGFDQIDGPIQIGISVCRDSAGAEVHKYVTAKRAVVGEVLFCIHLCSLGQSQILEPVVRVLPHDVPEDGVSADLDHRFRPNLGFFSEATAESTG